ncbi:MAG: hypothetical protein V2I82_16215 [Halieaceae bacterium]|jgi:hypothetical protein|nr:hypothetical protein [Halieaceae bacterium]
MRAILFLLIVALLSTPLWLAPMAVDEVARSAAGASLSIDDVESAKRLIRENDPRRLRDGERRRVALTQREVNLMLAYALPRAAATHIDLREGLVRASASLPIPETMLGSFINLEATFLREGQGLAPGSLQVGSLRLPRWLLRAAIVALERAGASLAPELSSLLAAIESIEAREGAIDVVYRWRSDLLEQLKDRGQSLALSEPLRTAILSHYNSIATVAPTLRPGASLGELLGPLFAHALQRTQDGANAAEENRALLLALGLAMQGSNPDRLAGADPVMRVRSLPLTLRGRRDLAQHFAVSAALAAGGGSAFADAVGVFKELSDSQGGSGFSFADLLADRAGVVLAEAATGGRAAYIQASLARQTDEAWFMPRIDRLPEGLQELEFRRRYDDLDTRAYGEASDELERRIAGLALYGRN